MSEMPLEEAMQKGRSYADDERHKDTPSVSRTLVREIDRLTGELAAKTAQAERLVAEIELTVRDELLSTGGFSRLTAALRQYRGEQT